MSKIKSVQPNGTFEGAHGLRYKWEIELEDGEVGEVITVAEGRWNTGDEVEYEKTESQWGVKLKLQKPNMGGGNWSGGGGANKGQSADVQKRIDACWSIGQAITLLGSVPEEISIEKWLEDVDDVSKMLITLRDSKL